MKIAVTAGYQSPPIVTEFKMSPHRTRWVWCALVMLAGPTYNPVRSATARTPPKTPATIEAHAKFFQDFFSVQLSPYKIEFGHVCEDPNTWEQRYERKDYKNHRDMGKVRWGDKQGGYGEHYWDLNHAGHDNNHGHDNHHGNDDYGLDSDDSSYNVHEHDNNDSYDEPSDRSPNYSSDHYDPEKASYEETNRAKRHPKTKAEDNIEDYGDVKRIKPRLRKHKDLKNKDLNAAAATRIVVEDVEDDTQVKNNSKQENKNNKVKHRPALKELNFEDDDNVDANIETEQVVQPKSEPQHQYTPQLRSEPTRYVPYEAGAGVRQYIPPDVTPAASVPRLFLEPSTGRVVDRATGQAYILQPIVANYNYNVN